MRIVIIGPPGSGRSTQGRFLAEKYGVPQLSVADMLNAEVDNGTDVGRKIASTLDAGELVSDAIVLKLVRQRVSQPDCKDGYLFDDFPRTLVQAGKSKEQNVGVDIVVVLDVSDEVIVERFHARRQQPVSTHGYQVVRNVPGKEGSPESARRPADEPEGKRERLVRKHLEVYHSHSQPLVDYYYKWALLHDPDSPTFVRVDGSGSVEQVRERILEALD